MSIKIGVIGSGSWATAMIKMLTDNQQEKQINWWVRRQEDLEYIETYHHNPSYLSAVEIKLDKIDLFQEVKDVFENSDIIILNTPAAYLEDALKDLSPNDFQNKLVVSAIKGIVPSIKMIVGEFLNNKFQVALEDIVVVGGPCHAEEVSLEKLSYLTFASKNTANSAVVAQYFQTHYIKTVVSNDLLGVEYGAVLKNIYALAWGICHGLGFGDNFQAVLISNAIREMEHFVNVIDPQKREINQSAYLGDLLVTSYSQFSRNRTFGNMIGKGYSVKSAQLEMNMVAEGYFASGCIQDIIHEHHLEMPICNTVYNILYKNQPALLEVKKLTEQLT
ncbi:NAD(P)H-dependent glycerol-3-phosphate dehydrogenase [Sphingobacterium sp. 1.A.4]|uniref:NAD(P)H-dependent glycerol-3-phosphate dehydrogenase n=1 Tax=Sphingobacterium sp. 1.A.4 TaxID=2044603 RepID=UPI000C0BEE90|nr:NAD(P)H-dependent glycerol-3-phosphate dehydrogenase [Sphingobacterium sp. 1.A.4]